MKDDADLTPSAQGAEPPSPARARSMADFDAGDAIERVRRRQESDPPCMPLLGDDDQTAFSLRFGDRQSWSEEADRAYINGLVTSLGKQRVAFIRNCNCVVDCEEWKHDRIAFGLVNHTSGDPNEGWTRV